MQMHTLKRSLFLAQTQRLFWFVVFLSSFLYYRALVEVPWATFLGVLLGSVVMFVLLGYFNGEPPRRIRFSGVSWGSVMGMLYLLIISESFTPPPEMFMPIAICAFSAWIFWRQHQMVKCIKEFLPETAL